MSPFLLYFSYKSVNKQNIFSNIKLAWKIEWQEYIYSINSPATRGIKVCFEVFIILMKNKWDIQKSA